MYYASFGILSFILILIINKDYFIKQEVEEPSLSRRRYRQFIFSVLIFILADVLWGYFFAKHILYLVYGDTAVFFLTMVTSVLLWTRFVAVYLGQERLFSKILIGAGWTISVSVLIAVIVNAFVPIIFYFDSDANYFPKYGRIVVLAMQICLFFATAVYTFIVARKTQGEKRSHYKAAGYSGLIMTVFIVLQEAYPLLPLYSIGLLIGTCMVHVFIVEAKKIEYAGELSKIKKRAEREHKVAVNATKKRITFGHIAESLASNYDLVYYVDVKDGSYAGYTIDDAYGHLEISRSGDDFFVDSVKRVSEIIYEDDRENVITILNKDYLMKLLEYQKKVDARYRMIVDGEPQYTRISVRLSRSKQHFTVAIENVDAEMRRQKEQQKQLNDEKRLARRDELTGIKNKTAYSELEETIQSSIDRKERTLPFAVAVCDVNDLKKVNDTEGHQAGDELIKAAAKMICNTFTHSPVYRIGGDEFVVFLQGDDFNSREVLVGRMRVNVMQNNIKKSGPVIAIGISEYDPKNDRRVTDVFEHADNLMYENKKELKAMQ